MKRNYTFISVLFQSKHSLYLFFGLLFFIESFTSPQASAQTIAVQNADNFPASDQMVFSYIQNPWRRKNADGTFTEYNANHNRVKLQISNKGTSALTISKATLSNTAAWTISLPRSLPITINAGSSIEATIEFKARELAPRVIVLHDKLTLSSNDKTTPAKVVQLHALWQRTGEGVREPWVKEIIKAFGFKTETGYDQNDGAIKGRYIVPNSDEIAAATFQRADATKPVSVIQMGAYHGCCYAGESFKWYNKGSNTTTTLFTHYYLDSQSLLPRKAGANSTLAQGNFNPAGAFGFKVESSNSDRTKNYAGKIGIRFWKAVDANGNVIPNAYIAANDYLGTDFTNYDYQDNVYYISNVKPEAGQTTSVLAASPSAVDFGSVLKGGSRTLSVSLKNNGRTGEASLKISSVELVGTNETEFTASTPSITTLSPQGSTSASVSFRPASKGIKNAALLVHYNATTSPLRIPLYGIADESGSSIVIYKRVKGAADSTVTIAGKDWESDKNYRKGSIKLDRQITPGPISATDQDVLYQTYLSAATNLAETREEIPVANGTYYVRLHFAENFFSSAGSRVFNINIEGQTRLTNFDIYREVGYRTALVKDFTTTVSDGMLHLKFNPTANRLALCGIEIFKSSGTAQTTSVLVATPSAIDFGSVLKGSSRTLSINLKNNGKTGEPSIKISGVELVGTSTTEFTASIPSTTTLSPQGSTSASVSFRPAIKNIKNAALLVHYNGDNSPLRVPLYGIANESGSTIAIYKRVKGGADASITIDSKVWESDKNYRKGSIKVNNQVTSDPIAGTDQDVLYRTYLSAAANLAETREEIPVANGTYYVRLHFAENFFTQAGSRVFNINIEGQTRLSNFDIYREVGYRAALVKDFTTTVSDGVLHLKFNPTANRLLLCGVEIFKSSSSAIASSSFPNEAQLDFQKEEKQNLQLNVYPNPSNGDKIFVEATNFAQQEEVTFTLHDLVGHTIEVKTVVAGDNGQITIQLAPGKRLSQGIYLLKGHGTTSGETQTKLLIE